MSISADKKVLPEKSYLSRYMLYFLRNKFKQPIDDYHYFPYKTIDKSENIFKFKKEKTSDLFKTISYNLKSEQKTFNFNEFMISSKTTSFIVIKNDKILYENYFNGYNRDSISRFFSVTKSITSALIGIAIDEGLIKSINEPIEQYIPEFNGQKIGSLTIKNLLEMDSGINYKEGHFPWTDDVKQYFTPDVKSLVLNLNVEDKIGEFFHYNDYHLHILALILERVTNNSIKSFLEEKIWKQVDMEYPALITVDSIENGFERMESGLCARAIDLAKFGRLFLNNGKWNGKRIISEKWVCESTNMNNLKDSPNLFMYYTKHPWGLWFNSGKAYYKYLWWGYKINDCEYDYFAMGTGGQILYISPRKNSIAVRLGNEWGIKGWWPTLIKELMDKI